MHKSTHSFRSGWSLPLQEVSDGCTKPSYGTYFAIAMLDPLGIPAVASKFTLAIVHSMSFSTVEAMRRMRARLLSGSQFDGRSGLRFALTATC